MREIYEKMRQHMERQEQSCRSLGPSTRDIVAKHYTDSELRQIVDELQTKPPSGDSIFQLWSFVVERQENRIPEPLRSQAAANVAGYLGTAGERLDAGAISIFASWGRRRADYRQVLEPLLQHDAGYIRMTALSCAGLFLPADSYRLLFRFQHDPFSAETGGMGGPLRFIVRDQALSVLEKLTGCPLISVDDCFEETADGRVSYRSWSLFLNWYDRNKKQFR